MITSPPPACILITGASSGIGAALARAYAAPGVTLALTGRDGRRLRQVARDCEAKGARALLETVDVQDRAAMADLIARTDAQAPLDLVIANAGISGGTRAGDGRETGETEEQARDIFSVNLAGVLNTVWPAIHAMTARGRGQIAIVSSLSGYRGLAGAPAYSASKTAVKAYGEALRPRLAKNGVGLSVICPGFVESRITARNDFPMPFFMTADKAARIIRRGLAANKAIIAFPWPMRLAAWVFGALPTRLAVWLAGRLPHKT
jgi:short-subunit dehydrogenase